MFIKMKKLLAISWECGILYVEYYPGGISSSPGKALLEAAKQRGAPA